LLDEIQNQDVQVWKIKENEINLFKQKSILKEGIILKDQKFFTDHYSLKELLKIPFNKTEYMDLLISQIASKDEFCLKNLGPLINHQIEVSWVFDYFHYGYEES